LHKYSTSNLYDWRGHRPPEQIEIEKRHFTALLSAPVYEDPWIVAFAVPSDRPLSPDARPLVAYSHGWTDARPDAQDRLNRRLANEAAIDVYAPAAATYRLAIDARGLGGPRQVSISLNGRERLAATVDQEQRLVLPDLFMNTGCNELVFKVTPPCEPQVTRCQSLSLLHLEWQGPD
jgi:hypothetical protein